MIDWLKRRRGKPQQGRLDAIFITACAVVICLFLVLSGWAPVTDILSGWAPIWLVQVVSGFSFMPHFVSIERGVLDLRDLFYYFSVIFFMLFANGVVLQNRRAT